jgi:nicotinamide-nucleotide amidase
MEADLAAAITGHLGPNAPTEQDGEVFVATGRREASSQQIEVVRFKLRATARVARQREATLVAIKRVLHRELLRE